MSTATQTAAQAYAITTVIQMFAEGARFGFISSSIAAHTRAATSYTAGTYIPVRGDGGTAVELAPSHLVSAIDWQNVWGTAVPLCPGPYP